MKAILFGAATAALLAGCASTKTVYTPDGRQGFSINCSGAALSWQECMVAASKKCGSRGYDVLERQESDGGAMIAPAFGAANVNRTMLIACKG